MTSFSKPRYRTMFFTYLSTAPYRAPCLLLGRITCSIWVVSTLFGSEHTARTPSSHESLAHQGKEYVANLKRCSFWSFEFQSSCSVWRIPASMLSIKEKEKTPNYNNSAFSHFNNNVWAVHYCLASTQRLHKHNNSMITLHRSTRLL